PSNRDNFESSLRLLDPSCDQFIIANFALGMVVGKARVGHFAPIVSYSKKTDEVLLFDPDTEFHQPYWASREKLFQAMLERDQTGAARGYLLIRRE
ncbi:MAG: phytochelatin synthase family protein, partial [Bdellovibrionota bacterium]